MTKKQTTQSANMFFNNNHYCPLFFTTLNNDILLVCHSALNSLTNYELLSHFMHTNNYQGLVIFNIPKNTDAASLKEWPNLKGLFYQDTNEELFNRGLEAIKQGELWFPRTISDIWMRQMLDSEQKTALQTNNLTDKEIKVLNLLFSGLHSSTIADSLFISEATVRVHLHKIYKKIAVKNKQQAIRWCQDNLKNMNSR
ncbi:helix-turn-helix transcriptional regulator [Pseudoalteromonas sp. S1609]|uniref:LuxR C-terminal-related transcriptional regulator n=1 Tax=Pseudoalteromonas sp. S1609 TaxID=579505 RepID=UPI00110BFD40|nr:LuxR C-terminal-related transcriptional regulator [Pseudoalteromonas sp. S1609]TMP69266.1 helix-turn-helix transcriptional regulator [Pseudoalteromonas sp. S1609]